VGEEKNLTDFKSPGEKNTRMGVLHQNGRLEDVVLFIGDHQNGAGPQSRGNAAPIENQKRVPREKGETGRGEVQSSTNEGEHPGKKRWAEFLYVLKIR